MSDRHQAQAALGGIEQRDLLGPLIESRQRYKELVEAVSDFCWETDAEGRFTFVSPKGALDWAAAELVGQEAHGFVTAPEIFRARAATTDDEVWFRRADGSSECLSIVALPLIAADGSWCGSRGLCRRVTAQRLQDRRTVQQHLQAQLTAHLARTMQSETDPAHALAAALSAVGLAIAATGGIVRRLLDDGRSAVAARWGTQPAEDEPAITATHHTIRGTSAFQGRENGTVLLWREHERGPFGDDDSAILALAAAPIGATIAQLASLEATLLLSRTDPLTGLLNRRAFVEEVTRRLARARHAGGPACLLYVDLDNFKLVNDTRGHAAGDAALLDLCRLLEANSRSGDLVARLGGDEFAMWLDGVGGTAAQERAGAVLAAATALARHSDDKTRPLGVSLGLAIHDGGLEEIEALLRRADAAMYVAKRGGKGRVAIAEAAA